MRNRIKMAVLSTAGLLLASCVVHPGGGEIAFAYSDGYWDRDHHWHEWRGDREAADFRNAHHEHYYDRRHDAEPNGGWHDNDRYWEHR